MTDKMTNQEAIDRLKLIRSPYMEVAIDMAIEALQAEPVKHGEWKYHHYKDINNTYVGFCECTVCKHREYLEHKYCPNCGAKMDGGNDEK